MFKTIKAKFVSIIIVILVISVGFPSYYLLDQFQTNFHDRSISMLNSSLDIAIGGLTNCMNSQGEKNIEAIVNRISENKGIDQVRIFKKDGRILFSSSPAEVDKDINVILPHLYYSTYREINFDDEGWYSATEPIKNEEGCERCHNPNEEIIAYLGIDTQITKAEQRFYTGTLHSVYLAIVILLLIFFTFYALFDSYINKPLKKFILALGEVENGNLKVRLTSNKQDEFETINQHFNSMVQKLDKSKKKIDELHFEQLQHANKLVTLGELTAELAHEINNPAAIIFSRADFLQMETADKKELKPYEDDIEVIMNQVNRVSKITGNILKYSKKLSTDFKPINLVAIITESIVILKPRMKKKNITVETSFENNDMTIIGDEIQIEQLVINLVNNASDAIEKDGLININAYDEESQTVLEIVDNGTGMSEEIAEQVFSPFFTTKEKDKGTGLGLYICSNICRNHKANITCESELGKGTKFKITFSR